MPRPLPRDLRKVLDRLEAEPNRPWRVEDLAAISGVARRTLHTHFRSFSAVHQWVLCAGALDRAPGVAACVAGRGVGGGELRNTIPVASRRATASVMAKALATLRRRSGSICLQRRRRSRWRLSVRRSLSAVRSDRPPRGAAGAEEIVAAIWRLHCMNVITASQAVTTCAVKLDDRGRLRVTLSLSRHQPVARWTHRWDGDRNDVFGFQERSPQASPA